MKSAVADDFLPTAVENLVDAGGYRIAIVSIPESRTDQLRSAWDLLRTRGADAVVLVSVDVESHKPIFLSAGNDAAVKAGFDAGAIVRALAQELGGRGGGKPAMAQGGGEDPTAIPAALSTLRETLGLT
jgi:alanyl-tRNA synthetase